MKPRSALARASRSLRPPSQGSSGPLKPLLALFSIASLALAACAPKAKTTFEAKPQALDAITCVAVLPFENLATADDDPGAGDAFADLLAVELLRTGRFQVMDRAESGRILAARGIYLGPTVDAETARALGEVLGVQAVLVGAVNEYRFKPARRDDRAARPLVGVTTKILDVKNGDTLWGTSFAGSPTTFFGDPSVPLTVAAQRVANDFSVTLASASGNRSELPAKPCWDAKAQSVLATLGGPAVRATPTAVAMNTPSATPIPTAVAIATAAPTATPVPAVSPTFLSETPAPARKALTAPQTALKEKMKPAGQFVLDGIAYTTPTGTVLAPVSSAPISDLAAVLLAYPEAKLRIEGHVDPTDPGPVPLSQKRAEAVVTKLQSLGVPSSQLEPKGMGGSKSLFPSFVEAMKAKNRRIEIGVVAAPPEGGAAVAAGTPGPAATPAPMATTARVKVLASKGRSAQAVKLANELKQSGTKITTIANVPEARTSTLIYYTAAFEGDAKKLAKQIPVPGGAKLTLYKTLGAGVDMVIVVGSDLK